MGKKNYATKSTYVSFNSRPPKKTAETTAATVNEKAHELMKQYDVSCENWTTLNKLVTSLVNAWEYNEDHFKRWWLDQLVMENAYMLWNAVFRQLRVREGWNDKTADKAAEEAYAKLLKEFA